jgi:hypothetical protein
MSCEVQASTSETVKRIESQRDTLRQHQQWWSDIEAELDQVEATSPHTRD